jgi:hypothetical protein
MSKAATNLLNYIPNYKEDGNDRFEHRGEKYPTLALAKKYTNQSNLVQPEAWARWKSNGWDQTIQYPLIDHQTTTVNQSAMTKCTAAVEEITTALGTIVNLEYWWEFTMKPDVDSANNYVGYDEEFKRKYLAGSREFASTLNTLMLNTVNNNVNTYFPAEMLAYYGLNAGLDAFQVPKAELPTLYNNMTGIMDIMNLDTVTDSFDVLATNKHFTDIKPYANQGSANQTNYAPDYNGFSFQQESEVPVGANETAAIILTPNTLWLDSTNAYDAKKGSMSGDGHEWAVVPDPTTGLEVGSLYNDSCASGKRQESFIYYTKVATVLPYNSDAATRYMPHLKVEVTA